MRRASLAGGPAMEWCVAGRKPANGPVRVAHGASRVGALCSLSRVTRASEAFSRPAGPSSSVH